jgi:hypothetical protein
MRRFFVMLTKSGSTAPVSLPRRQRRQGDRHTIRRSFGGSLLS